MSKKITVLISSAGRRTRLISCFREAAARLGVEITMLATDMNPAMSSACYAADSAFEVPHCLAPAFAEKIKALCAEHRVDLLVPTIDTELALLAQEVSAFRAFGTRINISSPAVVELARDKMKFHAFLQEHHLHTPRSGEAVEVRDALAGLPWPCIFKPRAGSRSIGIIRANGPDEVPQKVLNEKYVWQECWAGKEFTVNFFIGTDGHCKCVIPYERIEVRDGEIAKGATRRMPTLEGEVWRVAGELAALGAYGAHCTQAIVRGEDEFVLFELNARFGGGYPLADNAGASFAQWLLEDTLGLPSSADNNWKPNRVMLRYDDAYFYDGKA
jgi:carbamoyl-phosphate synthase large subunit